MKKYLILILVGLLILIIPIKLTAASFVTAESAILIDAETGEIFYRKNIHQPRPPASTTKIMTGILAIETGNLSDEVTASLEAAHEGGSSIYLTAGEKLTLKEMIYGLLVKSGNDAAVAIAQYIGGSVENFAAMMNFKAKQVGAKNTNFQNPNGLPQEGHLTTAYDLSQIARYALENDFFAQVVATPKKRISWPKHSWDRILKNTNKLLTRCDFVTGVKTGYTRAAGRCLVAAAEQGDRKLISVVLKSNQLWQDSLNLLHYGFDNFNKKCIVKKGAILDQVEIANQKLNLKAAKNAFQIVKNEREIKLQKKIKYKDNVKLPVLEGEKLGELILYDQKNELVDKIDLVADRRVELATGSRFWQEILTGIQIYF
ncbi:D-alanyl-D-alanine carboxypeptidase family protein [Halanaerobacter jeridensis]|uniref:serine-type D-Ala-D-Ala carboxypeptidase n=1 Tax=Halanaerobacter jeridensis TaxID=706427 RepID=A0A939BND8_9FIRM|nr:D-alanyl-D-alanine carboxypeptidase family protein [Halanaerobacter jeridensis]MBM7555307.1 D-alanyl-D-alanine carboxypeptidase (penicillin-binding protein 5/6) [Halanaerobacter jeridensis]